MRRIESRIHVEGDLYRFEILDSEDETVVGEEVLLESIHLATRTYSNETTAERHAKTWIGKFKAATESVRRRMCGYDSQSDCRPATRPVPPVREKVS